MFKTIAFTFLLFLLIQNTYAQQDTIFYDSSWKKCDRIFAQYYGIEKLDSLKNGTVSYYYITGQKQAFKTLKGGKKNGEQTWWYKNGARKCTGSYENDIENGKFSYWYTSGKLEQEGFFKKGQVVGVWYYWDTEGNKYIPYDKVEHKPLFNGVKTEKESSKELFRFIRAKVSEENTLLKGFVNMQCFIDEEGNTCNVSIINSSNPELEEKALRIARKLPKWKPATQSGYRIRVLIAIPFVFE